MTQPVPNIVNTVATGGASTNLFINEFRDRDPTSSDIQYPPQKRWINTSTMQEFILTGFTSSNGAVTANWELLSTGDLSFEQIEVDTSSGSGTDPVVPTTDGLLTLTGAQVATGTVGANVLRSASLAANSITLQIQRTTEAAAPDSTLNGVCHFDSSHFSVDSDGFVTLHGGSAAVDSFTPDTGTTPVVPTALGLVAVQGQATPSTSGIRVTGGTNALNIAMFSPFVGDFAFTDSTSGVTETLTISNTSDTASSQAQVLLSVAGTSAGDAWSQWTVGSTTSFGIGIDNSDSDILKLTYDGSATVSPSSGTTLMQVRTGGSVTKPLQPAFLASIVATSAGVTGAGSTYTMSGVDLSEFYDQGNNFDPSTGTFTAPVTGIYLFIGNFSVGNVTAAMTTGNITITATGQLTSAFNINPANLRNAGNFVVFPFTTVCRLIAGDTVTCSLNITNGAADTATIQGTAASDKFTYFSGFLIC